MGNILSRGKKDSEINNQNKLLRLQNQDLKKQIKSLKEIIERDNKKIANIQELDTKNLNTFST